MLQRALDGIAIVATLREDGYMDAPYFDTKAKGEDASPYDRGNLMRSTALSDIKASLYCHGWWPRLLAGESFPKDTAHAEGHIKAAHLGHRPEPAGMPSCQGLEGALTSRKLNAAKGVAKTIKHEATAKAMIIGAALEEFAKDLGRGGRATAAAAANIGKKTWVQMKRVGELMLESKLAAFLAKGAHKVKAGGEWVAGEIIDKIKYLGKIGEGIRLFMLIVLKQFVTGVVNILSIPANVLVNGVTVIISAAGWVKVNSYLTMESLAKWFNEEGGKLAGKFLDLFKVYDQSMLGDAFSSIKANWETKLKELDDFLLRGGFDRKGEMRWETWKDDQARLSRSRTLAAGRDVEEPQAGLDESYGVGQSREAEPAQAPAPQAGLGESYGVGQSHEAEPA